jgi:hypothetical protein
VAPKCIDHKKDANLIVARTGMTIIITKNLALQNQLLARATTQLQLDTTERESAAMVILHVRYPLRRIVRGSEDAARERLIIMSYH